VNDPFQSTLVLGHNAAGDVTGVLPYTISQNYRSQLEIYTVEAQQIFQSEKFTLIGGGRFQSGDFQNRNEHSIITYVNAAGSTLVPAWFENPIQNFSPGFDRLSLYGYGHWQMTSQLRLIAGLTYDWMRYPENFRAAPLSERRRESDLVAPKVGLIWNPFKHTALRAAWGRSLGGVSLDQSFRLEPSQVAGFNQAWRSIVPESVAGALSAEEFETWNVSLEHKFPTRTYLGLGGEMLRSQADRVLGVFDLTPPKPWIFPLPPFIFQSATPEVLHYRERSLTLTLDQLLGKEWSVGARYRLSEAELQGQFTELPAGATYYGGFERERDWRALMHHVNLNLNYAHRCGFFAGAGAVWLKQDNDGYGAMLANEDLWQFNLFLGYRFSRRQAELRLGLLNVADRDYRLNPLNLMSELPRERTLMLSFRAAF
jgi:outer membrane receptor protein involved in Fe transport